MHAYMYVCMDVWRQSESARNGMEYMIATIRSSTQDVCMCINICMHVCMYVCMETV